MKILIGTMPDFEDAVVDAVAEQNHANYILTRSIKDFTESAIPAITPTDFSFIFIMKFR